MRLGFSHALPLLTFIASVGCSAAPPETDAPAEQQETGDSALAPGCARAARVFTYDPVGWAHLGKAFSENPSPCAQYYIHLPALAGDKTEPRGPGAVDEVHGYGAQF